MRQPAAKWLLPSVLALAAVVPLLWRGVLVWVGKNPHYRKLYGPVSISKDYDKLSRKLIVEFLEDQRMHPELSPLVKPRTPFRYGGGKKLLKEFISTQLQDGRIKSLDFFRLHIPTGIVEVENDVALIDLLHEELRSSIRWDFMETW